MKKFLLSILTVAGLSASVQAQTLLSTGDVMFVGIQSGQSGQAAKDRFAFIILKDLAEGTLIHFTDNAVLNQSPVKFCKNEGVSRWTAGANTLAGTVVTISEDSIASSGTVQGGLAFSQTGDQVIAYQVNGSDTLSIGGISTTDWLATCSSGCGNTFGNNSATCLPNGLISGENVVNFSTEKNNAFLNVALLNGSPEEIRAIVTNPANWTRSDSLQTWPNWTATVVGNEKIQVLGSTKLYPNPAQSFLRFEGLKSGEIRIFDLNGKAVFNRQVDASIDQIQLPKLSSGLYRIQVPGENKSLPLSIQ